MSGQAMELFLQRQGALSPTIDRPWPKLSALLEQNYLTYIDFALAQELLVTPMAENEAAAALICHLSAASRQGHLCIEITQTGVFPAPQDIWIGNRDTCNDETHLCLESSMEPLQGVDELIHLGAEKLPLNLITPFALTEIHPAALQTPLCRTLMTSNSQTGQRIYFHRNWYYETHFFRHCLRYSAAPPAIAFDSRQIQGQLNTLLEQNKLLNEQAEAILQGSQQALTIISGGPGTGKTYTAGLLVNILYEALPPEKKSSYEIALAAPTGKAAANLQKSLLRAAKGTEAAILPQAKTLHALLGIRGSDAPSEPLPALSADLLIVDESSMIDVRLMSQLFASLKPGARLILLGDPLQLPAVESGSLFADLIAAAELIDHSAAIQLNTCLRAELKGIVDFATAVKNGDSASCLKVLEHPLENSGVQRLPFEGGMADICTHALPFYQTASLANAVPEILLAHFERFRMLTPFRKGPYGVEAINARILKELSKIRTSKSPFIAPIILLRNEPRLELCNGETGVLVSHTPDAAISGEFAQGDYVLFPARGDQESIRSIPALLLPNFEYAYSLSVHKSQGSEFEQVLLLLPEGSEAFGREVFYTAITRARKKLELWDQPDVLQKTIARQSCRLSGLKDRLQVAKMPSMLI